MHSQTLKYHHLRRAVNYCTSEYCLITVIRNGLAPNRTLNQYFKSIHITSNAHYAIEMFWKVITYFPSISYQPFCCWNWNVPRQTGQFHSYSCHDFLRDKAFKTLILILHDKEGFAFYERGFQINALFLCWEIKGRVNTLHGSLHELSATRVNSMPAMSPPYLQLVKQFKNWLTLLNTSTFQVIEDCRHFDDVIVGPGNGLVSKIGKILPFY